ncbi:MAG: xylulokinase [Oscillospiraceae bacterium]|nr:xylulokinase [Oscillospiraceae bacterium]
MAYILGIDIGTSGTKTVLFDETGKAQASSTHEYPLYTPQNGYAEQNAEDWWNAVVNSVRDVLAESEVNPAEIKGVGLSGQMHGLVMLDGDNNVIRKSIIWCDQRTANEVNELNQKVGHDKLIEITANPAITGFTAAKILWVRNNEPENYEKCRHILLPKDYIRYMLTGEFATEVSDASGMQLLDIPKRDWSDEVLQKLSIDKALLAKVHESPEITGEITSRAAGLTGLKAGTPVVGGAGDNAAAAIGTGVVEDGKAFTTIGSSGVVFAHTSNISIDKGGRVHTFCCAVPGAWHVMGVTQSAGLSLKWFRDNLCWGEMETALGMNVDPYYLLDRMASDVPISANRLFYMPYLNGERTPHLDPNARGSFVGLSTMHKKHDLIRAVMEGVSYSLRDCVEVMREMNINVSDMMACGGGGTSKLWRQMLADLYACNVKTAHNSEGPALGVAILAAVGTGLYKSVPEACKAIIKIDREQAPIQENTEKYEKVYTMYRKLYPAMKGIFAELAGLQV